jgi:hypothetical protein
VRTHSPAGGAGGSRLAMLVERPRPVVTGRHGRALARGRPVDAASLESVFAIVAAKRNYLVPQTAGWLRIGEVIRNVTRSDTFGSSVRDLSVRERHRYRPVVARAILTLRAAIYEVGLVGRVADPAGALLRSPPAP